MLHVLREVLHLRARRLPLGAFFLDLSYRTDAYRTVYALQLGERLWVVHAFQKKAKQGIKTTTKEIDLIRARLKRLKQEFQP